MAISLAEDAAARAGVLAAPPAWYGDSSHHLGFAGTISLRTETLMQIVYDIVRSLARHGFKRVLLLNGHKWTNLPALASAARNIREFELPGVLTAVADPMYLARGIARQIKEANEHHAGELEISQVLYKFPHTIRSGRFSDAACDFTEAFGPFATDDLFGGGRDSIDQPWTSWEQQRIAPTGQFSSNRAASAEKAAVSRLHGGPTRGVLDVVAVATDEFANSSAAIFAASMMSASGPLPPQHKSCQMRSLSSWKRGSFRTARRSRGAQGRHGTPP